jgi:DNA-binding MarR family transcriptional regulator
MLTYQDLPEIIHQRSRLAICAVLYELSQANFNTIRDLTGLSDGNLSQHLRLLEDAGIVLIEKGFVRRRPRTTVSLTDEGVAAFEAEIETLRAFIKTIDNASSSKRSSSNVEQTPVPGQEA